MPYYNEEPKRDPNFDINRYQGTSGESSPGLLKSWPGKGFSELFATSSFGWAAGSLGLGLRGSGTEHFESQRT